MLNWLVGDLISVTFIRGLVFLIFFVIIISDASAMVAKDAIVVLTGNSPTVIGEYQISQLEEETIEKVAVCKF